MRAFSPLELVLLLLGLIVVVVFGVLFSGYGNCC